MVQDPASDPLYRDPDLAQLYDLDNDWGPDQERCLALARNAGSLLDLGCGTGRLVARLAERCFAVGVDPAAAMLAIARDRPGGDRAAWIEADARGLRLGRRFELIVLTGHAFQVFLTEADRRAVLRTIAAHLAPGGRFVFDSRNPLAAAWRGWTPERTRRLLRHPRLGEVEAWNEATQNVETGIVTYRTHYRVAADRQLFSAVSQIVFTPKERLAELLDDAGLAVVEWLGDWQGGAYRSDSYDIIPVGHSS